MAKRRHIDPKPVVKKKKAIAPCGVSYYYTGMTDKMLVNMRFYFSHTDWARMWEEWYLGVDQSGGARYPTLSSFINAKAESKEQAEFLWFYLGPKDKDSEKEQVKYSFATEGPVDWVKRRQTGGWFTGDNIRRISSEISRRMNGLEALQEAGNRVTLHSLVRAGQLARQIDEDFKGVFFLPGLSFGANEARARLYLELQEKALQLQAKAQDLYAKSHGINFDDMAGLERLYAATAMAAQQRAIEGGVVETRENKVLKSLTEMMLVKHQRYQLPLPPDVEEKIVDVVEADEEPQRRKKVQ